MFSVNPRLSGRAQPFSVPSAQSSGAGMTTKAGGPADHRCVTTASTRTTPRSWSAGFPIVALAVRFSAESALAPVSASGSAWVGQAGAMTVATRPNPFTILAGWPAGRVYRAAARHVPPRSSALPEAETDTETTAEMGTSMAKVWPLSPAATTAWSRRPA